MMAIAEVVVSCEGLEYSTKGRTIQAGCRIYCYWDCPVSTLFDSRWRCFHLTLHLSWKRSLMDLFPIVRPSPRFTCSRSFLHQKRWPLRWPWSIPSQLLLFLPWILNATWAEMHWVNRSSGLIPRTASTPAMGVEGRKWAIASRPSLCTGSLR